MIQDITQGGTRPLTGVGGPVTAPDFCGTDGVGMSEIPPVQTKWVPSGENRVVAQIFFSGGYD